MQNRFLLYETFNAKYLSFQDVSESFVPNDEFLHLISNNSILLMGPRGCGKTTLLKMLTPAGLFFWNSEEGKKVKENIKFTAIYVPSDIQWKNQFDYLNKHFEDKKELVEIITQFLFACNVQIAMCSTFNTVIGLGDFEPIEKVNLEYKLCSSLLKSWSISELCIPTFDNLELLILNRIRAVNSLIKKVIFKKETKSFESNIPDYVFDNFFDLIKLGCKSFENVIGYKNDHKWILCFDELEIVPKFIQLDLIKYLRSVDQKFLFKLTTTPLFNLENNVLDATQGNDFSTVKLWVYDEAGLRSWQEFCNRLLLNRFRKDYEKYGIGLESIFGKYSLDDIIKDELDDLSPIEREKLEYNGTFKPGLGKGSSMNYLFKRLSQTDSSFKNFLIRRSINPLDPHSDSKLVDKSIFLKFKVDAIYRVIYKGRTRKTPPIHYGLPYIFDLCDGNPRLVIGLIDDILQNSKKVFSEKKTISKQDQSKIIYDSSEKYFNLIKNHPDSTITSNNNEINLADDLLIKIGEYMQDKLIKDDFSATSPSTFRVDDEINHKLLNLLETALSLGAIVYLDPIESLSNTGIVGKRFRLSNFLTPKFKIPSRINSEARLSTILKIEESKQQSKLDFKE